MRDRMVEVALVALGMASQLVGLVLALGAVGKPGALNQTLLGELGAFAFGVTLVALGVVLRSRRPDHAIGWLFLVFGLVVGVSSVLWGVTLLSRIEGGDASLGMGAAWIGAIATTPVWAYLITALVVRFPSGHPHSATEARLLRWAPVVLVATGLTAALRPGPLLLYPAFDNPIQTPEAWQPVLVAVSNGAILAALVPGFVATVLMLRRYRGGAPLERLQLRWFAYGASLLVAASVLFIVVGVVVAPDNLRLREVTYALFAFAACSLPISVFQAITSHRLYDIDRIIGRTIAYGALTAILAGLYTASLRLFNALFVALTGQADEAALVLTTLVLATTFTPIKQRLERLAARRFETQPDPAVTEAAGLTPEQQASVEEIARRVAQEVLAVRARPRRPR